MKKSLLYLHMVRWRNLLLLVFSQLLFKYQVFPFFHSKSSLSNLEFSILILSVVSIAAGGYIINDVFDLNCDKINKPNKIYIPIFLSVELAKRYYMILSIIGFTAGVILCLILKKPIHIFTYSTVVLLLFIYSYRLKGTPLLGNIVTSMLVSFNLILLLLLDSKINETNEGVRLTLLFSIFAFIINLLREIIKDIEDLNGDYNYGLKTIPILIGTERTIRLVLLLSTIPLYLLINFGVMELIHYHIIIKIIYWVFVVFPFILFIYKTYNAKVKKQFAFISKLLKLVLTLGLLLIFLITI